MTDAVRELCEAAKAVLGAFTPQHMDMVDASNVGTRLDAALAALEQAAPEVCTWIEDDAGTFERSCGGAWEFPNGGPEENECVYCPKCGKRIKAAMYADIDTEEDARG